MTPHWSGSATVTDVHRRRRRAPARRRPAAARWRRRHGRRRRSPPRRSARPGAVASTLRPGSGVQRHRALDRASAEPDRARRRRPSRRAPGTTYSFDKFVGVDTALTSPRPAASARRGVRRRRRRRGWTQLFADHAAAWADLWESDITVSGQPELQDWIRSNLYALWSSIRAGTRRQHLAGRAQQRQLRGPDLLGRRDVDVSQPAADAPGRGASRSSSTGARRCPGARTNAPSYGYAGRLLSLERRRHGRPRPGVPQLEPAALPHADPPAGRHRARRRGSTTWPPATPTGCASHWPILEGIAEFWAEPRRPPTPTAPTRSTTSPAPTSTPTASTTACSPTPARRPRCATPTRAAADPRASPPRAVDEDRRPPADAVRRARSRSSCSTTATRAR